MPTSSCTATLIWSPPPLPSFDAPLHDAGGEPNHSYHLNNTPPTSATAHAVVASPPPLQEIGKQLGLACIDNSASTSGDTMCDQRLTSALFGPTLTNSTVLWSGWCSNRDNVHPHSEQRWRSVGHGTRPCSIFSCTAAVQLMSGASVLGLWTDGEVSPSEVSKVFAAATPHIQHMACIAVVTIPHASAATLVTDAFNVTVTAPFSALCSDFLLLVRVRDDPLDDFSHDDAEEKASLPIMRAVQAKGAFAAHWNTAYITSETTLHELQIVRAAEVLAVKTRPRPRPPPGFVSLGDSLYVHLERLLKDNDDEDENEEGRAAVVGRILRRPVELVAAAQTADKLNRLKMCCWVWRVRFPDLRDYVATALAVLEAASRTAFRSTSNSIMRQTSQTMSQEYCIELDEEKDQAAVTGTNEDEEEEEDEPKQEMCMHQPDADDGAFASGGGFDADDDEDNDGKTAGNTSPIKRQRVH